ncbi:MAG TPA: hypothetical protein VHO69_17475 [Phototrophicaceae bacterium]|nr:hypothetical protein [Phototrophicaceae bacterium]
MRTLAPIPLNTNWLFFPPTTATTDDLTPDAVWEPLAELAAWPQKQLLAFGAVYLECHFTLRPTTGCVRYWLHLQTAPEHTIIHLNGYLIGTTRHGEAFQANVTDQVTLDENEILLTVTAAGDFDSLYLQAQPCP